MATYHCSVKIVSRSTGRSSVGSAAYRAGEKIENKRDGITHDYTRKGGVLYSEVLLPANAPIAYSERAFLWNAVEKSEKGNRAQTAREIEVALPRELNKYEQAEMLREYIKENFVSRGMIADYSIHKSDKGNNNPHAHILLTMRSLDDKGQWMPKAKFVYELDKDGKKQYNPKTRQYKGHPQKTNDWDKKENVEVWRESWARIYNREMEKKTIPERVDHRSYQRQGIDREPTIHRGPAAHQLEKRGIKTERGNINREIENRNREYAKTIIEVREEVTALQAVTPSLFPYAREDFTVYGIEIPEGPQDKTVLTYTEPEDAAPDMEEIQAKEDALRQLLRAKQADAVAADGQHAEPVPERHKPEKRDNKTARIMERVERNRNRAREEYARETKKAPVPHRGEVSREQETTVLQRANARRDAHNHEKILVRERIRAEEERSRADAGRGREDKAPVHREKARVRGDMAAMRGVKLPLYSRAVMEMGRCKHIDNIYGMARALDTIRREDIQNHGDYGRRLGELRQKMNINIERKELMKEQIKRETKSVTTLETYRRYLPYRQEIEKAGFFQRGKLEQKYSRKIDTLERYESELRWNGINPETMTAAEQRERVNELRRELGAVEQESEGFVRQTIALEESRDMMKQLIEDRGIDYEARHLMRNREIRLERGMDR